MKNYEIVEMFSRYCAALNLTEDKAILYLDGTYQLATPGTVFLSTAPGLHRQILYGIMKNEQGGTVSPVFGHCKGDRIYGYMEGVISTINQSAPIRMPRNLGIAIGCINWMLLQEQKHRAMTIHEFDNIPSMVREALDGILNLVDAIQEAVVNDNIASEEEVCGPAEEDDEIDPAQTYEDLMKPFPKGAKLR